MIDITTRRDEGRQVEVLELSGRFDVYEAAPVREIVDHLIDSGMPRLLINLSQVNFIDSSGLALLMQTMKRCQQNEGDLHLCCLQRPVQLIFQLSRLDKALKVFDTEQDALDAF